MSNASELLRNTVFEHKDVVEYERWIVMPVRVESGHRQANFFSEDLYRFLIFFSGSWRRGRGRLRSLGNSSAGKNGDDQNQECMSEQEHRFKPNFPESAGLIVHAVPALPQPPLRA